MLWYHCGSLLFLVWHHKIKPKPTNCVQIQVTMYNTLLWQMHCTKTEKGTERLWSFWIRITPLEKTKQKTTVRNIGRADRNKISLTNVAWWVSTQANSLTGNVTKNRFDLIKPVSCSGECGILLQCDLIKVNMAADQYFSMQKLHTHIQTWGL